MFQLKKALIFSLFCLLFTLPAAALTAQNTPAQASPQVKISLVLSDNLTKTGVEAAAELRKSVAGFEDHCRVKVHTFGKGATSDSEFLENSELIFVYVHQAGVFEQARPHILRAISRGAHAYALGGTPAEETYKEMGVRFHPEVLAYYDQGGTANFTNMILSRLDKDLSIRYPYSSVITYPEAGIYSLEKDSIFTDHASFIRSYTHFEPSRPWVALYMFRYELLNGQHAHIDRQIREFERAGFNVLPFFGYPLAPAAEKFCIDDEGNPVIDFLVTNAFMQGGTSGELRTLFEKLGVPVINSIQTDQTVSEWKASRSGISIFQRTFHLSQPELTGHIQPTVTASIETEKGPEGEEYLEKKPIDEQIRRLVGRVRSWDNLQRKPNREKNVALVYYNYPPGKNNIGASYLNVLPQSMYNILRRLQREGYLLGSSFPADTTELFDAVMAGGRNVGNWAPAEIARMVRENNPVLVPIDLYKEWFSRLSPTFQEEVTRTWGAPEDAGIMTWTDDEGKKYLVLPALRYGNILLAPQPARGWGQDIEKMYHDVALPPHHQYIAFYLYMQNSFHADALIHLGTHGTHEWLSGKEAGLSQDDASEALIGDMVNIYPYIVDNVGEGLQAKRRGMAVIIDHLTPPFDSAGLNPELRELSSLISDYETAISKSPVLANAKLKEIGSLASQQGLIKDLNLESDLSDTDVHRLEHYLKEIAEKQTPFGLHTFGESPDPDYARATAEAIAGRRRELPPKERQEEIADIITKLQLSGDREMDALIQALNGRYIPAGQGNDPLRNPDALPTGKNFYAFDPSRIPSPAVYEAGSALAEELVNDYQEKHAGDFPDKVTFNLWSTETIRHEGIMESQILRLLGVKPNYDAYGRIRGLSVIPRNLLKRPRIDVVVIPSGLYRDLFSNLMKLIDEAVELAKNQDEADNYIRQHVRAARKILMEEEGLSQEEAEKLASVRMFSVPSGAYGTGLDQVIQASASWENEEQVSGVYFNRMSHLYGQGFWGDRAESADSTLGNSFSVNLFKRALSGTKTVVHSRSSNLYGALDNDDFFQYLGGTAMAIRSIDGSTPEVAVTNLTDPSEMGQETLDKFIGREMKSRYLNPKWIDRMLKEGYSGTRMVSNVISNLWGWQVSVPEAIGEQKWQQVYETYVEDKYGLDIREKFRAAGNTFAYQVALSKMLEAIRKNYWQAPKETADKLVTEYLATVDEAGLSCNGNVCNNRQLSDFIDKQAPLIEGLPPSSLETYHRQLTALDRVPGTGQAVPEAKQAAPAIEQAAPGSKQAPPDPEQAVPDPEQSVPDPEQAVPGPNARHQPETQVSGYTLEEISNSQHQPQAPDIPVALGMLALGGLFAFGLLRGARRDGY